MSIRRCALSTWSHHVEMKILPVNGQFVLVDMSIDPVIKGVSPVNKDVCPVNMVKTPC